MMKYLKMLDEIVAKILRGVVVFCCALIAVILLLRVFMRFTPVTFTMAWTDEIVEWAMAYMIFLTSALIMREGAHFKVDLLQEKFKGRLPIRILNLLVALFNVGFFSVFLYYAWDLFRKAQAPTAVLRAPRQIAYASIVLGGLLILIYCVRDVVVMFGRVIKGEPETGNEEK